MGGGNTNVITFWGSENEICRVAGFKITRGGFQNSTFGEQGSGIWGAGTTAQIEFNHITANQITTQNFSIQGPPPNAIDP